MSITIITTNDLNKTPLTKQKKCTYFILFFLLTLGLFASFGDIMCYWLDKSDSFQSLLHTLSFLVRWSNVFLYHGAPVLIVIVIIIYRDDLHSINVDGLYSILLIVTGLMGFYFNYLACLFVLSVLTLCYFVVAKKIKFTRIAPSVWVMSSLILIGFLLFILIIHNSLDPSALGNVFGDYIVNVSGPVVEEALFRGLLWGFLRDRKVKETRILIIQMLVFMIAHMTYAIVSPLAFWFVIPALGTLQGLLVLRSKSLAPSTLFHVLYNISLSLI